MDKLRLVCMKQQQWETFLQSLVQTQSSFFMHRPISLTFTFVAKPEYCSLTSAKHHFRLHWPRSRLDSLHRKINNTVLHGSKIQPTAGALVSVGTLNSRKAVKNVPNAVRTKMCDLIRTAPWRDAERHTFWAAHCIYNPPSPPAHGHEKKTAIQDFVQEGKHWMISINAAYKFTHRHYNIHKLSPK